MLSESAAWWATDATHYGHSSWMGALVVTMAMVIVGVLVLTVVWRLRRQSFDLELAKMWAELDDALPD
jgi:hypothetical protein